MLRQKALRGVAARSSSAWLRHHLGEMTAHPRADAPTVPQWKPSAATPRGAEAPSAIDSARQIRAARGQSPAPWACLGRLQTEGTPRAHWTGRTRGEAPAPGLSGRATSWLREDHSGTKGPIGPLRDGAAIGRRSFSTRAPSIGSKVAQQIGERARQRQQGRVWSLVIGGTAVGGFVIAALNTFQENLMFYITPTQALQKFEQEPSKNRFRLGGLVLDGSVRAFSNSSEMEFVVTDLETDILVRYRGALPDLFREGHSVVAEGYLKPMEEAHRNPSHFPAKATAGAPSPQAKTGGGETRAVEACAGEGLESGVEDVAQRARRMGVMFTAVEVLAKHDEKYMPKEVAAVIALNKAKQEAEAASAGEPAVLSTPPPGTIMRGRAPKETKKGMRQAPVESQAYEVNTS